MLSTCRSDGRNFSSSVGQGPAADRGGSDGDVAGLSRDTTSNRVDQDQCALNLPDVLSSVHPVVMRVVRRHVAPREYDDAEQAVLCELAKLRVASTPDNWVAYAARVAHNVCQGQLRDRYRSSSAVGLSVEGDVPASMRAEASNTQAIRGWIRDHLIPVLINSSPSKRTLSRRKIDLLILLGEPNRGSVSIKQLSRRLACQPAQIRRDLRALAQLARGLKCTPPST